MQDTLPEDHYFGLCKLYCHKTFYFILFYSLNSV
jgi:hypothetical protein